MHVSDDLGDVDGDVALGYDDHDDAAAAAAAVGLGDDRDRKVAICVRDLLVAADDRSGAQRSYEKRRHGGI